MSLASFIYIKPYHPLKPRGPYIVTLFLYRNLYVLDPLRFDECLTTIVRQPDSQEAWHE